MMTSHTSVKKPMFYNSVPVSLIPLALFLFLLAFTHSRESEFQHLFSPKTEKKLGRGLAPLGLFGTSCLVLFVSGLIPSDVHILHVGLSHVNNFFTLFFDGTGVVGYTHLWYNDLARKNIF